MEWLVKSIRETTKAPLIGWMHESLMVAPLTAPLAELDGIVFVSEWQKRINQRLPGQSRRLRPEASAGAAFPDAFSRNMPEQPD